MGSSAKHFMTITYGSVNGDIQRKVSQEDAEDICAKMDRAAGAREAMVATRAEAERAEAEGAGESALAKTIFSISSIAP
eukprot:13268413-Alexandrium_andersonii.AAC.1